MINIDQEFHLIRIENQLKKIESLIAQKVVNVDENVDWDKSTLMKKWGISSRTVANFQKKGLKFFKRGGRLYFKPEHRIEFETFKYPRA